VGIPSREGGARGVTRHLRAPHPQGTPNRDDGLELIVGVDVDGNLLGGRLLVVLGHLLFALPG
jgi:hypothetical protein